MLYSYVVEEDGERRVYFVVETKGGGNNNIRVSDVTNALFLADRLAPVNRATCDRIDEI